MRIPCPAFLLLLLGLGALSHAAEPKPVPPKPPWNRVVMIGASATAGFTMPDAAGNTHAEQVRLSRYLEAALPQPHEPVRNFGNLLFFMQPDETGSNQVHAAVEKEPTLVVGIDFLFWFCYGSMPDRARLPHLERGLRLLDGIHCPLILGDIPDASEAAKTMLSEEQIPSARVQAAANRRIKEWAATRPQVVVVPLADFMRTAMADQAFSLRGLSLPAGQTRRLLQEDKLHPSPAGAAALAVAILESYHLAHPELSTNVVQWNVAEVLRLGSQPGPVAPAKAASPK